MPYFPTSQKIWRPVRRIEPAHEGFADPCLTSWLTGRNLSNFNIIIENWYLCFRLHLYTFLRVIYHSRRYYLNENFFASWRAEMAYVLGFWYADGYMRQCKSYRISFFSKDFDVIANIRKLFSTNSPISLERNCWILCLHSKKMYYDLQTLGGVHAKSTTLKFPYVPEIYLRDFIRGYFDGDGSVHYIKYRATKNGKIYTNMRSNFTCGSRQFLESLQDILFETLGLVKKRVGQYGPHQFKLGFAQRDTFKLLKYLYYTGHRCSLKRKACYLDYIVQYLVSLQHL